MIILLNAGIRILRENVKLSLFWRNASISDWVPEVLVICWWQSFREESKLLRLGICSIGGKKFLATKRLLRRQRRGKTMLREWAWPRDHGRGPWKTMVVVGWKDSQQESIRKFYFKLLARLCLMGLLPVTPSPPVIPTALTKSPALLVFLIVKELKSESSKWKNEPGGKGNNMILQPISLPW